ncbi:MAG TPA: FAD-dependent oxidoreductase [Vicinamibacterales bacterium]
MGVPRIAIIGAGPTGLGSAYRLAQLGHSNFTVYERNTWAGGLAASFRDDAGFTWDIGGHIQFSHYDEFDRAMDATMGGDWLSHQRESWVWIRDRFIPYPFQNNTHFLPDADKRACLLGLIRRRNGDGDRPRNFEEWIRASFGDGIAETFMLPYNAKVWAYPPQSMEYGWIGERVAQVDLERIILNLLDNRVDAAWGPNNRFRFPATGGTGEIWRRMAANLPANTVRLGAAVQRIDPGARTLFFEDGSESQYDALISSMPLDTLVSMCDGLSLSAATPLKYSSVHIVGIGLEGAPPPQLATKCWIYFPEDSTPFYRLTVFSNYSPRNVPAPDRQWSVMVEVSESPVKPVRSDQVVDDVIRGLLATKVIGPADRIVSRWHQIAKHGYPTPFLGRDAVVMPLLDALSQHGIYSRGRFGAWKYEVSNQDHSFMQGVEVVNHLISGDEEVTLNRPDVVNGVKPGGTTR